MRKAILIILGVFVLIQFFPYGREHANPVVQTVPEWDSPETMNLFNGACKDCHSNETEWPWYSNVAPVSWLVQHDVYEGREHFNISEGPVSPRTLEEAVEEIEEGEMPLNIYIPLHSEADLTNEQRIALMEGLKRTFGNKPEIPQFPDSLNMIN